MATSQKLMGANIASMAERRQSPVHGGGPVCLSGSSPTMLLEELLKRPLDKRAKRRVT